VDEDFLFDVEYCVNTHANIFFFKQYIEEIIMDCHNVTLDLYFGMERKYRAWKKGWEGGCCCNKDICPVEYKDNSEIELVD
jgi:hypothetical protein